jgi:hypothetical protein
MDEDTAIGCLIGLIALGVAPFGYVINGWVLTVLWQWFVVGRFDAPPLRIPVAIGISLIVGLLTARYDTVSDDRNKEQRRTDARGNIFASVLSPLLVLGIGWIVRLFL